MSTQTDMGRAFEYAIGVALHKRARVRISESSFSSIASTSFNKISNVYQQVLLNAADIAVNHILEKEEIRSRNGDELRILFNSDSAGMRGDPRDVILSINGRTLGISCKHNHQALKHSRLSGTSDFVMKWGLDENGCSSDYWDRARPIFSELAKMKRDSHGSMRWDSIEDKGGLFYWPILDAWADEITRLCNQSSRKQELVCKALISYLIGRVDFYKVICEGRSRLIIQGYNFNNTLKSKLSKYPSSIVAINNKNGGQYSKTIVFNRGYSINFRIHSASSKVEPSLKFDINAIGLPVNDIYQQYFEIS